MATRKQKAKMFSPSPDPWTIPSWDQPGRIDVCFAGDQAGTVIASVHLRSSEKTLEGYREEVSNALLIKAAPALLSIAEAILKSFDAGHLEHKLGVQGGDEQVRLLRDAIATAKDIEGVKSK